ncbi:hypothetical protein SAMN05428951_10913 [Pseudomonas sp. OV546]|nr:hypothetical protein SAMN05428951_10913 [Pseudomonas sp. OV546]
MGGRFWYQSDSDTVCNQFDDCIQLIEFADFM